MEEFFDNTYNRYTNLDGLEWRVIEALMTSAEGADPVTKLSFKNGENLWKMLKYPTQDCLFKPNLTLEEKKEMIYTGSGESTSKRVFITPYIDDAWNEQACRLNVYVSGIKPKNHIISQVQITVEILVHNKLNNILGEGSVEDPTSNPSEYTPQGDVLIPLKSRATTMLKGVLAMLNGRFVAGVGKLQHNMAMDTASVTTFNVWNNRAYIGFAIPFFTLMSGVSISSGFGY